MRIWSLHPRYLDRQGLTACWRETLLAQAVLAGRTKGYRSHPQLERFRATPDPLAAVCAYLHDIALEADTRGYRYDRTRIDRALHGDPPVPRIEVTTGQLTYEWQWLLSKLQARSPEVATQHAAIDVPDPHPLFTVVDGPVAPWEKIQRETI